MRAHPFLEVDGYVIRQFIELECEGDGLSVCERLQRQGSQAVGRATTFVSLWSGTPLAVMCDTLEGYLTSRALPRDSTYFWLHYFSMRQLTSKPPSPKQLVSQTAAIIRRIGSTILLCDPWSAPKALERTWCVWELWNTQQAGAAFDLAMSFSQV